MSNVLSSDASPAKGRLVSSSPFGGFSGEDEVDMAAIARAAARRSKVSCPFFLSRVPASFPSPADDYEGDPLDIGSYLVERPETTFFVRADGDSMTGAGIPMGAPYFKCKKRLEALGTKVFSSNYALYGDMSRRVMALLEEVALEVEVYSIDEAFLLLPALPREELERLARKVRRRVLQGTGIPVRFGIAETKTFWHGRPSAKCGASARPTRSSSGAGA